MPSLKDIRRRIGSVKNTQKITRAMKLVAAAKFARANIAVTASRPYGKAFDDMVGRLIAAAGDEANSPLLAEREEKKSLVVVMATDRGFCGGLNTNLFKSTLNYVSAKRKIAVEINVAPWGKRAKQFAKKNQFNQLLDREKVTDSPSYQKAKELADELTGLYLKGEFDRIYLSFVEFKSAMTQVPTVVQLLPVKKAEQQLSGDKTETMDANILVEPQAKELLPALLKRVIASQIFRAMLEATASEHGARMTAMDSATNNAKEVIRKLTIQYNRARQAAITKELIEITSGAEAL
jgi:F-type H+-transporting ATPase subunit gamma